MTATTIYQQDIEKRKLLEQDLEKYLNLNYQLEATKDAMSVLIEDAFERQGGSDLMKKGEFSGQFKNVVDELLKDKATSELEKWETVRDTADLVRDKVSY